MLVVIATLVLTDVAETDGWNFVLYSWGLVPRSGGPRSRGLLPGSLSARHTLVPMHPGVPVYPVADLSTYDGIYHMLDRQYHRILSFVTHLIMFYGNSLRRPGVVERTSCVR